MDNSITFLTYDKTLHSTITEIDIVEFYKKATRQTDYLGIYEDEYSYSLNMERDLMIIAYTTEIVGILTITTSTRRKNLHVGTLAIAINTDFANKGVGTRLMSMALEWFNNNNSLSRLQLFVRTDNLRAIALYKKYNFSIEGELRNDTYISGTYYNVYPMSILK